MTGEQQTTGLLPSLFYRRNETFLIEGGIIKFGRRPKGPGRLLAKGFDGVWLVC